MFSKLLVGVVLMGFVFSGFSPSRYLSGVKTTTLGCLPAKMRLLKIKTSPHYRVYILHRIAVCSCWKVVLIFHQMSTSAFNPPVVFFEGGELYPIIGADKAQHVFHTLQRSLAITSATTQLLG